MRTGIQQLRAEIHSEARRTMKDIQIGGDTFNFEMVVDGADEGAYLDETPLKNSSGKEFGAVEVEKGKIHLRISLPKFVREDNVMPFSVTDIIMLELLRNDVEQALNRVLKGIVGDETDAMAATATSIECNITRRVAGNSTCSHVLNLINRSFYEGTNVVYQRASAKCK